MNETAKFQNPDALPVLYSIALADAVLAEVADTDAIGRFTASQLPRRGTNATHDVRSTRGDRMSGGTSLDPGPRSFDAAACLWSFGLRATRTHGPGIGDWYVDRVCASLRRHNAEYGR